jgi:PTH1 family peptidyl-tRNA hydrolase
MDSTKRLVVGLGNPGAEYSTTRHNVGFMAVDLIADEYSISLSKKKFNLIYGQGQVEGVPVVLAKPQSFMNRSGLPTRQIADYFRILSKDIFVIHDDIDLAFERIKIKTKGGDGGHRGVRSVMDAFGGGDFARLRIGVGRSEVGIGVVDHVLGKFDTAETKLLDHIITISGDAVVSFLCKGAEETMNRFNDRRNVFLT